jgi:tyrosinase
LYFQPSTKHTNLLGTFPFALKFDFNFKMRLFGFPTAVLALAGVVQSAAVEKRDLLTYLQAQTMENLKAAEANGTLEKRGSCNIFHAAVRRDWYDLSRQA